MFFTNAKEAGQAGFRPCKRCEPDRAPFAAAARESGHSRLPHIEESERPLSLKELASRVGISPYHFSRVFNKTTGVTPKEYANGKRSQRLIESLSDGRSVTQAIYDAGYGSPSRFYEGALIGSA